MRSKIKKIMVKKQTATLIKIKKLEKEAEKYIAMAKSKKF